eukprot:CAMPEP_0183466766 /NCGR_PEP_ID=MMETSP0370-20130417/149693_1 /TAXON_ID=268820 /ORGANISM="Peridinium aciculiferum, Strain PAER-2" /LENGTH=141 /DNA_ID=CAMNT_0025659063 /DNA_START=163 /DNA_END=588 /DNA_ORIENTATION=+
MTQWGCLYADSLWVEHPDIAVRAGDQELAERVGGIRGDASDLPVAGGELALQPAVRDAPDAHDAVVAADRQPQAARDDGQGADGPAGGLAEDPDQDALLQIPEPDGAVVAAAEGLLLGRQSSDCIHRSEVSKHDAEQIATV